MQQFDIYRSDADAAYQGAPGAYSEEAAQALLGDQARLMPCATLEQTFDAVEDGRALHAVVPVENAVSGTVPSVYELLLSHNLVVTGETIVNVDYVLVAPFFMVEYAYRRHRFPQQPFRNFFDFLRQAGAATPKLLKRDG